MADEQFPDQPENWNNVGKQVGAGLIEELARADIGKATTALVADIAGQILALCFKLFTPLGVGLAEGIAKAEDSIGPQLKEMAAAAASDVFGRDIPASAFGGKRRDGGAGGIGEALGKGIIDSIRGPGGTVEPGEAGAQRYLGLVVNMALEGWYQGWIFEFLSSLVPYIDIGKIESFSELDDTLANALGLGRLSRRVLGPIVDATCVTPLEWKINKDHRQTLLSAAQALREFARGGPMAGQMREELARQGWSDERIDVLLAQTYKRLSLEDVLLHLRHGVLGRDYAIQNLRDDGYDEATAELALDAAQVKRYDGINDNALGALTRAYVNRDIDDGEFRTLLPAIVAGELERDSVATSARTQRDLNVRHISQGDVEEAVRLAIVPRAYYRDWLVREGYPPEEALILELLLATKLDAETKADQHKEDLERERAAEKQAKADAAAKRLADVEKQRAIDRRGSIADLRRAAARGLIPIARLEDVLSAQYDPDFVAIVGALVEQDRLDYLAQQQARDDAAARAATKRIDVGALEQAVLNDVLTIDEFRASVLQRGIVAGDAEILTATLAARKADVDAAKKKRQEADAAAHKRTINLSVFETLVRRGHRSMADYNALLESLGFEDADRAAMEDLLQLQINDDAAARAAREAADAKDPARGLSVADFRRAVIIGLKNEEDFGGFLLALHYTPDAIALLVAELHQDVLEAEAARRKREEGDAGTGPPSLPLSTVARAARLGVVSPDVYQARLVDAGYSDDDVSIEMDLLLTEIADVQAARAKQAAADAAAPAPGLTLAQIAAAVKVGALHLEDYRAAAITKGLTVADVNTLQRVLADELTSTQAAAVRRAAIQSELKPADVNLADFADQVRKGDATIGDYHAALEQLGLHPVDVALLTDLLVAELAGGTGGA